MRPIFPLACAMLLACACGCRAREQNRLAEEETIPVPETSERKISLLFGGDIMQHIPQVNAARRNGGYDYTDCFKYLKPLFDKADLVVLNLETTVSKDGRYSGYPLFSSPAELIAALKGSGVDVLLLANNHIADMGRGGMLSTAESLSAAGIYYTGMSADTASRHPDDPLLLDINGIRLALLNYTYGINGMPLPAGTAVNIIDTTAIAAGLNRVDMDNTDYVVVLLHWGEEYSRVPSRRQRELARWCHEMGADFVVGSHPHVIQQVETVADSSGTLKNLTAYSLGNLVSNQRDRYTDGGMLLRLNITHMEGRAPEIYPEYILTWVYTPFVEGRRRYYVLTQAAADTLLENDPAARLRYDTFLTDSRLLLGGNSLVREAAD